MRIAATIVVLCAAFSVSRSCDAEDPPDDDDLIHSTKSLHNPVIRLPKKGDPEFGRYRVWDTCGWVKDGVYYSIIPFACVAILGAKRNRKASCKGSGPRRL